jgi:hypothetical protein
MSSGMIRDTGSYARRAEGQFIGSFSRVMRSSKIGEVQAKLRSVDVYWRRPVSGGGVRATAQVFLWSRGTTRQ